MARHDRLRDGDEADRRSWLACELELWKTKDFTETTGWKRHAVESVVNKIGSILLQRVIYLMRSVAQSTAVLALRPQFKSILFTFLVSPLTPCLRDRLDVRDDALKHGRLLTSLSDTSKHFPSTDWYKNRMRPFVADRINYSYSQSLKLEMRL